MKWLVLSLILRKSKSKKSTLESEIKELEGKINEYEGEPRSY